MGARLVAAGRRKACHQFLKAAIGRGFGLHHLAAPAGQHRAGDAVIAQHLDGSGVAYAQSGQQGFCRVRAARDVAACQRQILRRQGFQLRVQALRHHGFNHQALCQRCGVVGQRRHGHGSDAKAGHQHHGACDQALAVVVSKLLQALRSEINSILQEDKNSGGLLDQGPWAGSGCSELEPARRCPAKARMRHAGRPLEFIRLSGKCWFGFFQCEPAAAGDWTRL